MHTAKAKFYLALAEESFSYRGEKGEQNLPQLAFLQLLAITINI
jgi:hypothetical protein